MVDIVVVVGAYVGDGVGIGTVSGCVVDNRCVPEVFFLQKPEGA